MRPGRLLAVTVLCSIAVADEANAAAPWTLWQSVTSREAPSIGWTPLGEYRSEATCRAAMLRHRHEVVRLFDYSLDAHTGPHYVAVVVGDHAAARNLTAFEWRCLADVVDARGLGATSGAPRHVADVLETRDEPAPAGGIARSRDECEKEKRCEHHEVD